MTNVQFVAWLLRWQLAQLSVTMITIYRLLISFKQECHVTNKRTFLKMAPLSRAQAEIAEIARMASQHPRIIHMLGCVWVCRDDNAFFSIFFFFLNLFFFSPPPGWNDTHVWSQRSCHAKRVRRRACLWKKSFWTPVSSIPPNATHASRLLRTDSSRQRTAFQTGWLLTRPCPRTCLRFPHTRFGVLDSLDASTVHVYPIATILSRAHLCLHVLRHRLCLNIRCLKGYVTLAIKCVLNWSLPLFSTGNRFF